MYLFQKFNEWKEDVARDAAEKYPAVMETIRSCYENRKQELYRAAGSIAPSRVILKYEDLVEYQWTQYISGCPLWGKKIVPIIEGLV